jgi:tetratricopeptide (TPR) repeat protein
VFDELISILAAHDESALNAVEKTFLRLAYLYRGDCLFDSGRFDEARSAYEEVAWRYGNRPAAVSASMQIYHCHQRLGRLDEAAATLGRLGWLIAAIPADTFAAESGMPPKSYWEGMIRRLEQLTARSQ